MKRRMFPKAVALICPLLLFLLSVDSVTAKKANLVKLDEDSWSQLLSGEWMVEFFAPWCPACKQLEPQWEAFSSWSEDLGIKIGSVDVTANPGLSGRFMVTALPTIYHVKDGVFRQYRGSRDTNSFVSFVEEKQWEKLETLSKWKAPDSVQMSLISYFFKISMALRAVHNRLVEDYGIPYWGSYILFAFATILLGALLGLLIVCVIDLVFPAKSLDVHENLRSADGSNDTDRDIIEDNEPTDVRKRKGPIVASAADSQPVPPTSEESESKKDT